MIRKWITLFFLIFSPPFLSGDEQIKGVIAEKQQALSRASSDQEKSQIFYDLAFAYYEDQELDRAFTSFLEALKSLKKYPSPEMSSEERPLFENALADYLTQTADPTHIAEGLLQKYGGIADQNPHFLHLNFLMATAYANLGRFDDFFSRFYRGYPYLHDSFLAYKTQGILYLRLSHHGKSCEERQGFQQEAFDNLTLALARNPQDASLYKVLIFLAKDENNVSLIHSYLQQIVKNQVVLPRNDVYLYVREAAALQAFELGQEMIDQARSHYEYSRAILEAQQYLNIAIRG
jgi:tetratricopeptide (TPR) repeat protein